MAVLIAVTAGLRVWTLRTIDLGGDATFKWFFIRSWAYGNAWVFDHHTARFSINVPAWMAQKLFGTHPNVIFVAPVAAAVAQVPLLYGAGRALDARAAGVLACLGLLLFEPVVDASSQFLPGIFQATYVLGALHAVLRFARAPEGGERWLALGGVWLFAAYLAMVTSVYVLPGVAAAAWLVRRSWRDVGLILGTFAVGVALETLAYARWSEYPLGQFQLILDTHSNVEPTSFWGLFARYAALPHDWQAVLIAFGVCFAAWVAMRVGTRAPEARAKGTYALWLVPGSTLAGMTFGVKGVDPIVPAMVFNTRYFDLLMPLVALCLATSLVFAGRLLGRRFRLQASRPVTGLAAAAAVCATAWAAHRAYGPVAEHTFRITDREWRTLNTAFARGVPIVGGNRTRHFQNKTLTCIQWGYLEDRHLLQDGRLVLHKLGNVKHRNRAHRYLARPETRSAEVARRLRAQTCVVTAVRRAGEPKLGLSVYGGEECPELENGALD